MVQRLKAGLTGHRFLDLLESDRQSRSVCLQLTGHVSSISACHVEVGLHDPSERVDVFIASFYALAVLTQHCPLERFWVLEIPDLEPDTSNFSDRFLAAR